MIYTLPGKWDAKTPLGFWYTNWSLNLEQMTRPFNNQQKNRFCRIVGFAVPVYHRIKLKENEKKNKYLNLAREVKKLWYIKITIILILIGALSTVTQGLVQWL